MNMTKHDLRLLTLHEFKLEHNASEASANINRAWGEESTRDRTVRRWFGKFRSGDESLSVWWSAIGVIHYSFLGVNETINAERYCNDLAVMHARLSEKRPALVNRRGPILLHDNARPHVARMTVQKLTELGYETLLHPPYSPYLSPTDYHLFKHLSTFLDGKTFRSKQEVETTFKDFVASQPLTFYQQGINNLVVRWQRCIAAQGSYFD
ncbi:Transposase type 1 [Trinorchestia longiramus]|nr:Transposase type 1 [Trinorchestia longiramus]